jgi:AcrR family transcriptional regulator
MGRQVPQADRVLDAAATCVARVGIAKTTLDDVARAAGCARATVYRYFPGKQPLLGALVAREITALREQVVTAADAEESLAGAATAAVVTAARVLHHHRAVAFVAAHEPELLLPYLAFERESAVLREAATLVAPAFERFVDAGTSVRLGEWLARLTLSYLCSPSPHVDVTDPAQVRQLVDDFVLPGFVRPISTPRGIR